MTYCPYCGTQINEYDNECYQCGYKFKIEAKNENRDNFKTISRSDGKIAGFKVQSKNTFKKIYSSENGTLKIKR